MSTLTHSVQVLSLQVRSNMPWLTFTKHRKSLTLKKFSVFWESGGVGKKVVGGAFYKGYLGFIFFSFILISWRLITLQYCSGFCHTLTWISHDLHGFPIPIPPPASLPIPSLWVFPVHHPWALVSCIQPGLAICFTLDSIFVSMLFSQNIPPLPSPTESQSLFYTSESLFLFCI